MAFRQFGADADDVRDLIADISEAISEFATVGQGPLVDFQRHLGITQNDLASLGSEAERVDLVLRRVGQLPVAQQRFILARLTDATASQFVGAFVRQYQQGIAEAEADFRKRGLILPADSAKALAQLGGQLGQLSTLIGVDLSAIVGANVEGIRTFAQAVERNLPQVTTRLLGVSRLLSENIELIGTLIRFFPTTALAAGGGLPAGAGLSQAYTQLRVAQENATLQRRSRQVQQAEARLQRAETRLSQAEIAFRNEPTVENRRATFRAERRVENLGRRLGLLTVGLARTEQLTRRLANPLPCLDPERALCWRRYVSCRSCP